MNKFFTTLLLMTAICVVSNANAQLTLADPDYDQANPLDCAGIIPGAGTNFTDGAGNYAPNTNEVLVLCPDLAQGSKVSIAFATNIGFTWNVDATDMLFIYDGPSTASPLIGGFNSVTDPNGFFVQASWNNPSGCLTLEFISDGATEGTGWDANVACGNPQQPFEPHMEAYINGVGANALNPIDTGYVDVCFGDSIMFIAKPLFPNSFEINGYGYSQNVGNCTYDWTIGGVGTFNNDTIWFTPPARAGYFVDLRVQDQFPLIERITCKVRVSQLPSFLGTGPMEDTVCLGQNTNLVGGVTPTDTVGIDIPFGEFEIGGIFAGLTQLPDGTGAVYTTNIAITGFNDTTEITTGADIDQLCIDIEHSYIGDLEIALTCPNGTMVSLMNAFNQAGGLVPGGCGNGISTSLGNDTDIDGGAPGSPVWTYCFSETSNTFGTICAENALGNTIVNDYGFQSMNPNGVYLPDGAWSGFAGCPINGTWTITVQDNQGIDDGYIFQWGLYFNQALYPNSEGYQNYVVSENWVNDPTIISGQNDTLLVVQPDTPGNYGYTYEIVDDFGCEYDTTVFLYVLPQPAVQNDTLACNYGYQLFGTTSYNGGVWTVADTALHFQPNEFADNPYVYVTVPGTYTLTYTDDACSTPVTVEIEFPSYVWANLYDTTLCQGVTMTLLAQGHASITDWSWNTGASGPSIEVSEPGVYIVVGSNICHSGTDTSYIDYKLCDIDAPNIISMSSNSGNQTWFVESEGMAEFHCTILNRWGNVIYEFSDPNGSWDGTSNGTKVAEGTYYYIIDAVIEGGEELQKHGFIQVVH